MDPLCLFCKSFSDDVDRFARLLDSVELHWRADRAGAAVMLDSDFYFLRDFHRSDFIDADGTPFFVASLVPHAWEDDVPQVRQAVGGTGAIPNVTAAECLSYAAGSKVPPPRSLLARLRRFRVESPINEWFGRTGPALWYMPGPAEADPPALPPLPVRRRDRGSPRPGDHAGGHRPPLPGGRAGGAAPEHRGVLTQTSPLPVACVVSTPGGPWRRVRGGIDPSRKRSI